tara:strand:+ start:359 stop:553 length:195 start_codon:yes stop_codon:yes gene_type:complete
MPIAKKSDGWYWSEEGRWVDARGPFQTLREIEDQMGVRGWIKRRERDRGCGERETTEESEKGMQ